MRWHQRFCWLLLVLLPTQLGYHFWPEWAGVLGRRVDYLAPTIYTTDLLLLFTVGFWLVPPFIQWVRGNPKFEFLNPKQIQRYNIQIFQTKHLWMMVGVVFVVVNIFFSTNRPVAVYKWIKVSEYVLMGWYIVRTKPKLSAVITPLSIGVLYSSILAIIQFILQHSVGGPLWWLGERTFGVDTPGIARFDSCQLSAVSCQLFLRPYATFPHPNVLGGFLAVLLPGIIQYSNNPINKLSNRMKTFYGGVFIIGIAALILTFSRSAVAVGGVAIVIAIARIMNYELRIMKCIRIVVASFVGIVIVVLTSYFMIHNSTEESVVVRGQLNAAAIKLWQSSPLFGEGLGNFLVRLPEALPSRTIYFLQPAHNIYLLLLSEVGIVGVGLIVLWIASRLNYEFGIRNYGKKNSKELFIIHTSLFIILLLGLVDHYSLTLQQGQLLLTVMIGMSLIFFQSNKVTK